MSRDGGHSFPEKPLAVTVLAGGPSAERQISLKSGTAVAEALRRCGHDVVLADISPDDLSALQRRPLDVVFVALHGAFGEDGNLQQILEDRGIAYTGSGPAASCLAMNKPAAKAMFRDAGLATPDWLVRHSALSDSDCEQIFRRLGRPVVLKPTASGSSIDVAIVHTPAELAQTAQHVLTNGEAVLLEQHVAGREFTVGILEGRALPVLEIRPVEAFFNFRAKYQSAQTDYILDVDISPQSCRYLQQAAVTAFEALGCRDFARVDVILPAEGPPYVLEVNTIPGFTERSLLPMAARRAGLSFEQLCQRLVRLALARRR